MMSDTTWTEVTVREELPDVRVTFNGKEHVGWLRGRKMEEATVVVKLGREQFVDRKFPWHAVTRSLNDNHPLRF